jgi:hypothetical protein
VQTENQPLIDQSPQPSSAALSATRDSLMGMIEHWKKKAFAYLQLAKKEKDPVGRKFYESSALSIAYCIQDVEKNLSLKLPACSTSLPPASEAKAQTSTIEALIRRLESLQHRAIYEPQCPNCKDKKMIAGDPEHPERGLKRCEACKPSPTPESCLLCEKPYAIGHHSSDCLAKLKEENARLTTAYSELRTAAFEYFEAESKYQEAHLKNEAGIGVSLKASEAHMKLRGVLADSVEFAAGLQITSNKVPIVIDMILPCPKCGLQHVDAPEPENGWDNPPHKSHLCHGCGTIFRPADVPTNGVAQIKTRGENDSPNNLLNTQTNGSTVA